MAKDTITIVSGLPRSGTSMMMKMLEAGGLEILTDNIRTPDNDNPKGYYEFEKVKQLDKDQSWLADARGKAVKVISALLDKLPTDYAYKVLFMRRDMNEILASQRKMLIRRGEPTNTISDEKMAQYFQAHLRKVEAWLAEQPHVETMFVTYNEVMENPIEHARRINAFLGGALDEEAMVGVVDKSLYRQRT